MADLFGRNREEELLQAEKLLLGFMAWCIEPLNSQILSMAAAKIGMSLKEAKKLLDTLQQSGKVIYGEHHGVYTAGQAYTLPIDVLLQLLWQFKEIPSDQVRLFKSVSYYSYWQDLLNGWRTSLLTYASTGQCTTFPRSLDFDGVMRSLFKAMLSDPRWRGFCFQLPEDILLDLFRHEEIQWNDQLGKPDHTYLRELFLDNPMISAESEWIYRDYYSLAEYVLPGRINDLPSLHAEGLWGTAAHALYHQYQGRYKEAITLYQSVLKVAGGAFLGHPLFDTTYVLALMQATDASSKKKLSVLLKKRDLRDLNDLVPAHLLIRLALHEDTHEQVSYAERNFALFSPHIKVLTALIIHHYHLSENNSMHIDWVEKTVDHDHLKLFQLECSQDFPRFIARADALKQELGLTPLLPPFKKLTEWEKSLATLMDLTAGKEDASPTGTKAESQSRIIYHINRHQQITPRLQKSKNGTSWSGGRNIALTTFKKQAVEGMNETDRRLAACVRSYTGGWGQADYSELDGAAAFAVLAGYPLVFMEENPDVPVVITKEEPQLVVTNAPGGYRVNANATPPFDSTLVLSKENDQLYRVLTLNPVQRKVIETFHRSSYFPIHAKAQLAELLNRLSRIITVHSDLMQSDEKLRTVKGDTLITVQLQPMGEGVKAELFVKPFVDQPPYCKAGQGASGVIGVVAGKRVQAVRNFKKEQEHFDIISRLMQRVSGDRTATDVIFFDDYYQCLELIDALRQESKISRTEWPEGVRFILNRSADLSNLNLSFRSAGQWFEVDGELNVDARLQLKIGELLQKVRESKGRFIALGDSEFLALSQQLRRQLEEMDAVLQRDKKSLKISRMNAASMAEIEQLGVSLTKDNAFVALQQRIEEAGKQKFALPRNLRAELRGYQEEGFRWLSRLAHWGAGACLADDMGLGKTLQTIALMLSRGKRGASLVIAPASVLLNWKNEIERFAPALTSVVMYSTDQDRKALVGAATAFDVVLTTYGLLINEAELLAAKPWNIIVLDEAHTIKNKETKMSKAAMELQGEFRLLLTGTPIQNHLSEIWNLFQFANPGLLGSFQHFNDCFIQPIEKEEDKLRQKQLKKILQPFLLRRTKTQVLDELPEKTEITLSVELSAPERALYENLREQALLNLEEQTGGAMQTLAEITRLRQAACHPALVNKELSLASSKTQAFLKLTDELMTNNHRALVFSQFTSHLALIRQELDALGIDYLYLDGSLSVTERTALVKQFQTGDQPLFLISLKAGGTGLNLTAADYVIHLDPWWNPAVEDQASDRAHRIGQTRPVTIYRLISRQTIEEKIIRLHQTKKSLADSLLDGSDLAHKLTKEEMLELLRGADY